MLLTLRLPAGCCLGPAVATMSQIGHPEASFSKTHSLSRKPIYASPTTAWTPRLRQPFHSLWSVRSVRTLEAGIDGHLPAPPARTSEDSYIYNSATESLALPRPFHQLEPSYTHWQPRIGDSHQRNQRALSDLSVCTIGRPRCLLKDHPRTVSPSPVAHFEPAGCRY